MNFKVALLFLCVLPLALLAEDIPSNLRGGIEADGETIRQAQALVEAGWIYVMPEPKSSKASWGNPDKRTTWFIGYWENTGAQETSHTHPQLKDGAYTGDGQPGKDEKGRIWRKGGSPERPTKLQWLCSKSGGFKPAK